MGNGATGGNYDTPQHVKGVGGTGYLSGITAIAPGWYHALAQASDGTVYGWGENTYGQLGNGTTAATQATPVKMLLPCNAAPPVPGPCQLAPVCLPTGVWSLPDVADGTSCNDGNACTQTDTCEAGTCVGSNPVICSASDQCHVAGTCDPATGVCSNPDQPDGTACNDGNACTDDDVCTAGVCAGTPYTCSPPATCQEPGTCNGDGTCSFANQLDDTDCGNGLACVSGTCGPKWASIYQGCDEGSPLPDVEAAICVNLPSATSAAFGALFLSGDDDGSVTIYEGSNCTGSQVQVSNSTNFCGLTYPNGDPVNDNVQSIGF
jgi:Regulator of chromosome condensation (RCC1) repeat